MKRKLLASILALCMVLTLCPVTVFAEEGNEQEAAVDVADEVPSYTVTGKITAGGQGNELAAVKDARVTLYMKDKNGGDKYTATSDIGYVYEVENDTNIYGYQINLKNALETDKYYRVVIAKTDKTPQASFENVEPNNGNGTADIQLYASSVNGTVTAEDGVDLSTADGATVALVKNTGGNYEAVKTGMVVVYSLTPDTGTYTIFLDGYDLDSNEEYKVVIAENGTNYAASEADVEVTAGNRVANVVLGAVAPSEGKTYTINYTYSGSADKSKLPTQYEDETGNATTDAVKAAIVELVNAKVGNAFKAVTAADVTIGENNAVTVTLADAETEVVEGFYSIQYKYTGKVDVTALPDAYQDTTGKPSDAEVIAAIVKLVNEKLGEGFKAVTAADVTISKQVATVTLVKEVKVAPAVNAQEDGTVTATVSTDVANSITEETEALTITATTDNADAGTTNVTLPDAVVTALTNKASKNVTVDVQTDAADVTLTSEALKEIQKVAGEKPVALNVTNSGDMKGVTDSAVTADNSETFGVAVKVDGEEKTISGLHEKPMTLAFKLGSALKAKLASSNPVVFWIDRTGSSPVLRRMGGVTFDKGTGAVSFKTSHFSEYIVMNEEDAKSVKATPTEITMSKSVRDGMQDFTVRGYDYYSDCGFKLYVQVKFGDAVAITDRNADTESINVTGKVNSAVEVFEVENAISYNADGSVSTSYLGYGKSA